MTRRKFITFVVCALCSSTAVATKGVFRTCGKSESSLTKGIAEHLITDLEFARQMGQSYIKQYPEHANTSVLAWCLRLSGLDINNCDRVETERRVRIDFQYGNTLTIDGWVLSRSEAYLYALLALTD